MAAEFDKERLVLLQSTESQRVRQFRMPPFRSGTEEEFETDSERANVLRALPQSSGVTERITSDRASKIQRVTERNMFKSAEDERQCLATFHKDTFIETPCKDKPFSDNVPNPLRRRNPELVYFKD